MWSFCLSVPDGYLIAILGAGIPLFGGVACGVGAWVFRNLSNGDRRVTKLETQMENVQEDIKEIKTGLAGRS